MSREAPAPVPPPVSVAVRRTTVAAVLLVAAVAAVVSYAHMQQVATRAGEAWRAWLLPLSVDGLMVAASMVLLTRRRAGQPVGVLAWSALLAGVTASLAANVAAAQPTGTARVVAAWPAVAFAVAFELLLQQHRTVRTAPPAETVDPPSAAQVQPDQAPTGWVSPDGPATNEPAPGEAAEAGELAGLAARAAQILAAADGRVVGRRVLARELGCSEHRARVLLDGLSPNGSPPRLGVSQHG